MKNRQVAEVNRGDIFRFYIPLAASQNRLHTRDQFARIEWLGEVVVGAKFETENFIDIFIARREHENRGGMICRPQTAAHLEAVEFREHYIQHDQGGMFVARQIERRLAVFCRDDAKTFAFEIHPREFDDGGFVVDEEDEFVHRQRLETGDRGLEKNHREVRNIREEKFIP